MHDIYKLKDMLTDELEEYGRKGELSAGSLEIIDKLSHALKSVTTILAMEDSEQSNWGYPPYSREQNRGSNRGNSYTGRSNARRDSMGRYSREYSGAVDDMIDQLRTMMDEAPDQSTRAEIQRLVTKMEKM
jgi:hypothetical protein